MPIVFISRQLSGLAVPAGYCAKFELSKDSSPLVLRTSERLAFDLSPKFPALRFFHSSSRSVLAGFLRLELAHAFH